MHQMGLFLHQTPYLKYRSIRMNLNCHNSQLQSSYPKVTWPNIHYPILSSSRLTPTTTSPKLIHLRTYWPTTFFLLTSTTHFYSYHLPTFLLLTSHLVLQTYLPPFVITIVVMKFFNHHHLTFELIPLTLLSTTIILLLLGAFLIDLPISLAMCN